MTAKRIYDLIFSSIGLIMLSSLFLIIAILIKVMAKVPVFYRGVRIGKNGRPLRIYKFLTMIQDAEKIGASSTSSDDPSLTSIGKFIRKYKLDEIPQLINVFLGDMSFVGPCPEVKKFVDKYGRRKKIIDGSTGNHRLGLY